MIKQLLSLLLLFIGLSSTAFPETTISTNRQTKELPTANNRYAATLTPKNSSTILAVKGSPMKLNIELKNTGRSSIRNITYQVKINKDVSEPILYTLTGGFLSPGKSRDITLPFTVPNISGTHSIEFQILKINNRVNSETKAPIPLQLKVLSRKVYRKPCIEEYTATWCGWCPNGIVAFEKAHQVWGDKICLIASHDDSEMRCFDYIDIQRASKVNGYPAVCINRKEVGNPWTSLFSQNNYKKINDMMESFSPADIDIDLQLNANNKMLTVNTITRFLYTGTSNTRLSFVLLEDSLAKNGWYQSNYYAGKERERDPLFDRWTNGKPKVKCAWDHVAIAQKGGIYGVDNSIPKHVKEEEPIANTVRFMLSSYQVIQKLNKLSVIVQLIDQSTGEILHSEQAYLKLTNGIKEIQTNKDQLEIARYNTSGLRLQQPTKGINLIKYADGSVKKVMVK